MARTILKSDDLPRPEGTIPFMPPVLIPSEVFPDRAGLTAPAQDHHTYMPDTDADVGRDESDAVDDIPDPVTPLSVVVQSMLSPTMDPSTAEGQMAMNVDQALFKFSEHAGRVLSSVEKSWDAALRVLNHNQSGVEALAIALTNYKPCVPFSASISVVSPAGYPMILNVQNATQEGFMEQMGTMMAFLQDNGFTAQIPIPF